MSLPRKDIHCHILPGVDDGFQDAQASLKALERMVSEGVEEVVFTPHLNPDVYPDADEALMRRTYESFKASIPESLGLTTSLAAEYMVVNRFEERASDPSLLTWDDGTILIEMSYYFPSENIEKAIFELRMAGRQPILAHPERYLYLADNLHRLDAFKDMGCRLQMNLYSLSGAYGPASVKILKYLMGRGMYDFAATDLHTLGQLENILSMLKKRKNRKLLEKIICG